MSSETEALKAEAERAVRRGELLDAVGLYQQVLTATPDDAAAASRLKALSEQVSGEDGSGASPHPTAAAARMTAEQRAEKLFEDGDAKGAVAIYAEILRIRPDHLLAAERKREIEASLVASDLPEPRIDATPKVVPFVAAPRPSREDFLNILLKRIEERRRAIEPA